MNVNTPRGLLRCVSPACLYECHEAQVVFRCVCPVCPVALCASCSRPGVVRRELVGDKRLIINDSGHRTRGNFTDEVTTSTGISLTRLITSASTVITANEIGFI